MASLQISWVLLAFCTQTWLLFRHGILPLAACLSGLESPQVVHRTNSNAVFSLLTATRRAKDGRKTINYFLAIYMDLFLTPITECFAMV